MYLQPIPQSVFGQIISRVVLCALLLVNTDQQMVPVITLVATASNSFIRDFRSHAAAVAGLALLALDNT